MQPHTPLSFKLEKNTLQQNFNLPFRNWPKRSELCSCRFPGLSWELIKVASPGLSALSETTI